MRDMEDIIRRRRGAWSHEEDSILINYISTHGLSLSWNQLALNAGLNRTGKSCRLRWLNYLSPNIVRGNFTLQDQLYIMQLHCFYGNRWSKIAEHLPGRTDNEIKNYWRTRVYKLAKLLKCDINSTEFRDFIANILVPRLSQQVQAHNNDDPLQIDDWAGFYDDILPEPVPIVDSGPQDFLCSPFISYGYDDGIQCQTSYNCEDDFFRLWP